MKLQYIISTSRVTGQTVVFKVHDLQNNINFDMCVYISRFIDYSKSIYVSFNQDLTVDCVSASESFLTIGLFFLEIFWHNPAKLNVFWHKF